MSRKLDYWNCYEWKSQCKIAEYVNSFQANISDRMLPEAYVERGAQFLIYLKTIIPVVIQLFLHRCPIIRNP